jgi:monothiol glutaredoxin
MTDHLLEEKAKTMSQIESDDDIRSRIDQVVRKHSVVLFMKGTPTQPQCGFSAATVKVLRRYDVDIHAVDVLADAAVREGIKDYADWPTIPQLYVGGTFVGGCDIVRAMHAENELEGVLAPHLRTAGAA